MAVNLTPPDEGNLHPIDGVQLSVAQAGIKQPGRDDLTLMLLAPGCRIGAVFTRNRFCAAPVQVARSHLASGSEIRALVVNTGNANAGTGQGGRDAAQAVCRAVAAQNGCQTEQVLPFSTGVILEPLPTDKILAALPELAPAAWSRAAGAIMTTDTVPKAASRQFSVDGHTVSVTGIAKGSGMIHPNMATMLGFVFTDAAVEAGLLQAMTARACDDSFNAITVDGDTSTNDSFIVAATGRSSLPEITDAASPAAQALQTALKEVALELAQAIVRDGEGATKFITVEVQNAGSREEARAVGYAVAKSPLVKTAFYASDPNLGRILAAIGYAGIADLDTDRIRVYLGEVLVAEHGGRAASYREEDGQAVMNESDITITIDLQRGQVNSKIYTCDLSKEYVAINADYRS